MQALLVDAVWAVLHREPSHAIDLRMDGFFGSKVGFFGPLTAWPGLRWCPVALTQCVKRELYAAGQRVNIGGWKVQVESTNRAGTLVISFARMGIASSRFWNVEPCT